jgi:hypothetical protein
MTARFPFTDLHSFKDYVGFVQLCCPDRWPVRGGVSAAEQWSLDLAFRGLRLGIDLSQKEKGDLPVFTEASRLIEQAYAHYADGEVREGFQVMDRLVELLGTVPSW